RAWCRQQRQSVRHEVLFGEEPELLPDLEAGAGSRHPAKRDNESAGSGQGVLVQRVRRELRQNVRRDRKTPQPGQNSVDQPFRPAALIRLPVLAAGLTLFAGVAALAQQMHRTVAAIDQPLRAAVERKDVPGVVAMAANRHEVLYRRAFGTMDGDHSRPMAEDAIFQIASMTKAVTSVALMQLV